MPRTPSTPVTSEEPAADPAILRDRLADRLIGNGFIRSEMVEAAFRRVPRHLFAPEASLAQAYADDVVRTKQTTDGVSLSAVSAPWLQAWMLEHSGLAAGGRGLEIGSGGYNAALMAELVGPSGQVVTVDIDAFVTERARRFLDQAGYQKVVVLHADGENGAAEHTPREGFDAIIITAEAWDVAPAWISQLAAGGRLVVPLRVHGYTRAIAFEKQPDGTLISRAFTVCGFVPVQGAGAHQPQFVPVRGTTARLSFGDGPAPAAAGSLEAALEAEPVERATGVTIGGMVSFDTLQWWLATSVDGFCQLTVDPQADLAPLCWRRKSDTAALLHGDSFAYLNYREISDGDEAAGRSLYEFIVNGHGPQAREAAGRIVEQVRAWDARYRHGPGPRITVCPGRTPTASLPEGQVVDKRHVRLVFTWDTGDAGASGGGQENRHGR